MKEKGKVVLVTGGASGLGAATVDWFAKQGDKVTVFGHFRGDRAAELEAEYGENVFCFSGDVTNEADVEEAVRATAEHFGKLDVLVTCAGIGSANKVVGRDGPHPLDKFERVIQIDLIGTFNALRFAAAEMMKNEPNEEGERGVIIFTSSIAAWEGQFGQIAYSAAKGGVNGMVLTAARELGPHGIRVMGIAPGFVATPQVMRLPEKVIDAICEKIPFPSRPGKAEEFAHLVNAIVENPLINGTVYRLDGASRLQAR